MILIDQLADTLGRGEPSDSLISIFSSSDVLILKRNDKVNFSGHRQKLSYRKLKIIGEAAKLTEGHKSKIHEYFLVNPERIAVRV